MTIATETECPSTTLYYRSGSSDKEYQIAIEPSGPGYVVNFAYGRRGGTLQTGSKTNIPVGYDEAGTIFDKLVREKTAKGYTPGEAGMPYQQTDRGDRATGIVPQLLNTIVENDVERLIADRQWWTQEKHDGKHVLIRRVGNTITGINRNGLTIALPEPIITTARTIGSQQWIIDGEAIGDTLFVFDLLESACTDLRPIPYRARMNSLEKIVPKDGPVQLVQTARHTDEKQEMLNTLRVRNAEGIVFKRWDAAYTPGRPASGGDQLKLKFVATASCIVARSTGSKRSVKLELIDGSGRVAVGNVTIPANHAIPNAGQIVEVRYLYAYPGGSLYQPVYLGIRDDIDTIACTVNQLKFKREHVVGFESPVAAQGHYRPPVRHQLLGRRRAALRSDS